MKKRLHVAVVQDSVGESHPKAVQLVVSKVDDICRDYDSLFGPDWKTTWAVTLAIVAEANPIPDDAKYALINLKERMVMMTVKSRCDFEFRFVRLVLSFPWLLAWLVYRPPATVCERRHPSDYTNKARQVWPSPS